ncbi:mucin-binding protein [Secundilactobacillus similis]|uniref:Mucin binding domain-containing protein n=1 Tax=Secundilactobacillus similis DSM 23365 = JCM 2765 TaxID=1423804 RepID=A0A0R2FD69_9LACO|nr:hypothetical protein [Secundilactobacillus similis]KRN26514.1 hypothetical protein FD14_GL001376 [Secundilactobacillus similis DSM 23365 = JCM 2765]
MQVKPSQVISGIGATLSLLLLNNLIKTPQVQADPVPSTTTVTSTQVSDADPFTLDALTDSLQRDTTVSLTNSNDHIHAYLTHAKQLSNHQLVISQRSQYIGLVDTSDDFSFVKFWLSETANGTSYYHDKVRHVTIDGKSYAAIIIPNHILLEAHRRYMQDGNPAYINVNHHMTELTGFDALSLPFVAEPLQIVLPTINTQADRQSALTHLVGQTVNLVDSDQRVFGTYQLKASDIVLTHDDTKAGTYSYRLSDTGLTHVQAVLAQLNQITATHNGMYYSLDTNVTGHVTLTPNPTTTDSSHGNGGTTTGSSSESTTSESGSSSTATNANTNSGADTGSESTTSNSHSETTTSTSASESTTTSSANETTGSSSSNRSNSGSDTATTSATHVTTSSETTPSVSSSTHTTASEPLPVVSQLINTTFPTLTTGTLPVTPDLVTTLTTSFRSTTSNPVARPAQPTTPKAVTTSGSTTTQSTTSSDRQTPVTVSTATPRTGLATVLYINAETGRPIASEAFTGTIGEDIPFDTYQYMANLQQQGYYVTSNGTNGDAQFQSTPGVYKVLMRQQAQSANPVGTTAQSQQTPRSQTTVTETTPHQSGATPAPATTTHHRTRLKAKKLERVASQPAVMDDTDAILSSAAGTLSDDSLIHSQLGAFFVSISGKINFGYPVS